MKGGRSGHSPVSVLYMSGKILVIGGDARIDRLCTSMQRDGLNVRRYTEDMALKTALGEADIVILGLPVSTDGETVCAPQLLQPILMKDLFRLMNNRQLLLGGKFSEKDRTLLEVYGIPYADYLCREEMEIANAIPTAEGAIQIAMEELPITLNGATAVVTGYGRIGKYLSKILKDLGADTTVFARKLSDFALIKAAGLTPAPYNLLPEAAAYADVIFNTVPAKVIGKSVLENMRGGLIIDLAGGSGGVDAEAARTLGVRVIRALSLPGKVAPVTAGEIIKETIYNIFRESGE
ncbi:MAG: dipicolinate synthase subunit DpsA [Clostridia bacterium]